jgi:Ran GTPase-activating protein (RanGAP) involved in mRNA processing and transport
MLHKSLRAKIIYEFKHLSFKNKQKFITFFYNTTSTHLPITIQELPKIIRGYQPPKLFLKDLEILYTFFTDPRIRQTLQDTVPRTNSLSSILQSDVASTISSYLHPTQVDKLSVVHPSTRRNVYQKILPSLKIKKITDVSEIPLLKYMTRLETLQIDQYMEEKDVELLSKMFTYIPRLKTLSFHDSNLNGIKLGKLSHNLYVLKNLKNLFIVTNRLHTVHPRENKSIGQFFSNISKLTTIEKLHLNNNQLYNNDITELATSLPKLIHLKELCIQNNQILSQGAIQLSNGLRELNNLEWISFSNNSIGEEGLVALSKTIAHSPQLEVLELSNIGIYQFRMETETTIVGFYELCKSLRFTPLLSELVISHNNIHPSGFEFLSKCFVSFDTYLTNLQVLDIQSNPMNPVACKHFGRCLFHLKKLEILSIDSCSIGENGFQHISEPLSQLRSLDTLHIMNNNLKKAYRKVAETLLQLKTLNVLKMESNQFDSSAYILFGKVFGHLENLTVLIIFEENVFNEQAYLSIFKGIYHLPLQMLSFNFPNLDENHFLKKKLYITLYQLKETLTHLKLNNQVWESDELENLFSYIETQIGNIQTSQQQQSSQQEMDFQLSQEQKESDEESSEEELSDQEWGL